MKRTGKLFDLFTAFSAIAARAYQNKHLLSCPILAKTSTAHVALTNFLQQKGEHNESFVSGAKNSQRARLTAIRKKIKTVFWVLLAPLQILRISIRYLCTNGGHFFFLFFIKMSTLVLRWRMPCELANPLQASAHTAMHTSQTPSAIFTQTFTHAGAQKPVLIIDTFALLPKIAQEKRYQEMYMPSVAEQAYAMGYTPIRLYRLYGSRNPIKARECLDVFSLSGKGITEVHLLRFCDWFALLWHIIVYPIALIRLILSLRKYPPCSAEAAIRQTLIATAGQCVLGGESRRLAGKRLGNIMQTISEREHSTHSENLKNLAMVGQTKTEQENQNKQENQREQEKTTQQALAQHVVAQQTDEQHVVAQQADACAQGYRIDENTSAYTTSKVLSWYENQTIDKTFIHGFKQAQAQGESKTPFIGAQLFLFSPTLLNCYADDAEASLKVTPDVIAVTGTYFLPKDSKQRYVIGPALRYQHIFAAPTFFSSHPAKTQTQPASPKQSVPTQSVANQSLPNQSVANQSLPNQSVPIQSVAKNNRGKEHTRNKECTLLVLLSYHKNEITLALQFVQQALQTNHPFTKILYKFHPATSFTNYKHLLPAAPEFAPSALTDSLATSDIVIGSASGALPEAVCLQKPVLVITDPTSSSASTPLPPLGQHELWAEVTQPQDVQPTLQKLINFQEHPEYLERLHNFTHCLFTEPSPKNIQALLSLSLEL